MNPSQTRGYGHDSKLSRIAELLHVLMLPDFERADRIGGFWGNPTPRQTHPL
jgi:hypothetical protein